MLNNFLFITFLRLEQCSEKLSLLSKVTPSSLKEFTTLTLTSTVLLFIICFTLISDGNFTLLFVTNMKYVLEQLRSSLLTKQQSNKGLILARKRFIKMFRSWSASYRVVSSANILHVSSTMNPKSFIIRRKNSGPKTLPWGTPSYIDIREDSFLLNLTP